jgi:hypothetical protein
MGERKILNKYFDPSFDPSLVPKMKNTKKGKSIAAKNNDMVEVRMMLPFTFQCSTCNTFQYRGKKCNSRKEAKQGDDGKYLGIQIWRFYIKCNVCNRGITFCTDPEKGDYTMESGGSRTYEVWKDKEEEKEEVKKDRAEEDKLDAMKALENRVRDSKREMEELDALDEIKMMNERNSKGGGGLEGALEKLGNKRVRSEEEQDEEDERLVKSIKFGRALDGDEEGIDRLESDDDDNDDEAEEERTVTSSSSSFAPSNVVVTAPVIKKAPVILIKKKKAVAKKVEAVSKPAAAGALSMLGDYGSDSD